MYAQSKRHTQGKSHVWKCTECEKIAGKAVRWLRECAQVKNVPKIVYNAKNVYNVTMC